MSVFTNILQAHPDLNGVFCANNMVAFGAINAIESAGKAGQVFVTSYDALDAAKVAIKNGSMLSSRSNGILCCKICCRFTPR